MQSVALSKLLFAFEAFGKFAKRHLLFATALCLFACSADVASDNLGAPEQQALTTAVYRINCGADAVSPFSADQFANGGNTWFTNVVVTTTGVTNAAPAAVYQSERYGNYSYVFGSLTPGASYTARLHFAETKFTAAGSRVFNVLINGAAVLTNFDIFAAAGSNKALVRDFNATASSAGQLTIQYVSVVDNAKSSGIELLTVDGGGVPPANQPPTVATVAAGSPNPTTSTTTRLSVLGADDGGEPNLTYTWAVSGTPPAAVSFSSNASNAAKGTTATFTKAGSYALIATIKDAAGSSVTSSVTVVVSQQLTSIAVTPTAPQIASGATQQFSASAKDQFGTALAAQPAMSWAVSGGGTINSAGLFTATTAGTFTVTATASGVTGSASVVVTPVAGSAVYRVNCGGDAATPFSADQFASGGSTWTVTTAVSTTGVTNAAPTAVYQSERYGNHSYVFGSLTAGATYVARLHFAETKYTTSGSRVFRVSINGTQVLNNFDIFASAGANKALVLDFTATASSSGQITVQYVNIVDNAKSSGIEILSSGGGSPPPPNQPPTVVTAASAASNPTTGSSTSLSVLGADDGGESNLSYAWAVSGTPPAAVSFSANSSNAAKNTVATFSKIGSYTLIATIRDASGATVTSTVNVAVNPTLTAISVTPSSAQVAAGATQQFLASASDQFGSALSPQPTIVWSVSAGGSINSVGLFTAGSSSGGPFTVSAKNGAVTGTASVSVTGGAPGFSTSFNLTEFPISESGAWKHAGLDWTRVKTANGFAFGSQTGGGGFDDSYAYLSGTYPANQSASAVIHLESGITAAFQEVEILLRWTDSAHNSIGYECNLAFTGQYAEIIKWPGPLGTQKSDYTWISTGNPVNGGVHDGDVFQADVIGNVITSRLNGKVIASGVDNSIPSGGAPGIGFYAEGAPASQKFSFSSFSATGL